MAQPLKDSFGFDVIHQIASMIEAAAGRRRIAFDSDAFVADASDGFDELELTQRARHVSAAMGAHLPEDRGVALSLLLDSLGPTLAESGEQGMTPFRYLPHVYFVADHGQQHLEAALEFQYQVTRRFTAEFSIRSYLEGINRDATLDRLSLWAQDTDEHVRRLVSEGTRPRLPWAPRLPEFIEDPTPVLELLERLRHDPSEYVRRSVANNLNDIAKDHPEVVVAVCGRWWSDIDHESASAGETQAVRERWMIGHALRTLVKQGHPGALAVLGFDATSPITITRSDVTPANVRIGQQVTIELTAWNPSEETAAALIDLRVHFVKANGTTSPKVFKGAEVELEAGDSQTIRKTVRLNQQTTRTHYPGLHVVDALVNGVEVAVGSFELRRD